MNTLTHLCKKDFAYAKPWLIGTWLALLLGALLPWLSPAGDSPFILIAKIGPLLLIFLTTSNLVQGDPLIGTNSFMGTRPVTPIRLLVGKLLVIAVLLVLPAMLLAVLGAAFMRVHLSAADYLLLAIEKALVFAIAAAWALVGSVFTRRVGPLIFASTALGACGLWLVFSIFSRPVSGELTLDVGHLQTSQSLVAQAALIIAAIALAMSWALRRQIGFTFGVFVVSAVSLASLHKTWTWNFVNTLSKEATLAEIIYEKPQLDWQSDARLVSDRSEENISCSQLKRPGRVTGLKDGWSGKLIRFKSEAHFADGTVWTSKGGSQRQPFESPLSQILPHFDSRGSDAPPLRNDQKFQDWTLFEWENPSLEKQTNPRASIRGTGIFQLDQPRILGNMRAIPGASVVIGRFRYVLESVFELENCITYKISITGAALRSRGDNAFLAFDDFLFTNLGTGQFTDTRGSSGASYGSSDRATIIQDSVSINHPRRTYSDEETEAFLKSAHLHIIGTRYGGNITLPFDVPEMLLENRR